MIIAHNISAINTYNRMGVSSKSTDKSMEKLSSGYRINRAADDAAGLSISEKMRSQIRGLNQASDNAQQGISMIQTAEGALNEAHSICQRMRELAVQAANDTNAASDREALQGEIDQLTSEINRIGNTTEFNGMKLLNGSKTTTTGKEEVVIAKAGQVDIAMGTPGASNTAGLQLKANIQIADTSSDTSLINTKKLHALEGSNTIEISKKDGKLIANIKLTEATDATGATASNRTLSVVADELVQDSNGDWTYNNNGISFTITKESAQDFITNGSDSEKARIDLFTANGSIDGQAVDSVREYNFNNEYEADSSFKGQIKNMEISEWANNDRIDFDRIEVEYQNALNTEKASLTVKYFSGSDLVITDTRTYDGLGNVGTDTTIPYESNGLSFDLSLADGFQSIDKVHAVIDLDSKLNTQTVVGNGLGVDNSVYFHVGANTNQVINTTFGDMRAAALGLTGTGEAYSESYTVNNGTDRELTEKGLNISTRAGANLAIDIIDSAVEKISAERSKYGAIQNRLEYTINNVDTTSENMTSAESTIRDTDMAEEMMDMTKNQILQQASQAMLSQAMQRPQQVLQLLQG